MIRQHKPEHIGETLKDLFREIDASGAGVISREKILSAWKKAAGEKAMRHSSPARIKGNTLLVNVDSTAWIYQLRLNEQDIINKINRLIETKKIEKLKFRSVDT